MKKIPISEARKCLTDLVRRVRYGGETIVLMDRGVDAAVLASVPAPKPKRVKRNRAVAAVA